MASIRRIIILLVVVLRSCTAYNWNAIFHYRTCRAHRANQSIELHFRFDLLDAADGSTNVSLEFARLHDSTVLIQVRFACTVAMHSP